jgi:uncharacterized protein
MTSSRILVLALSSCIVCFARTTVHADSPSLPLPVRVEKLDSVKVGEVREFWVSLPDRYLETTERFPVVYMMDGDFNFNSGGIGALRHAAQMGEMPEFILVGIRNTSRSKDIFPEVVTYPDGTKDGGRANQYLDFIHDELVPYVEKTYRTERLRVLFGTSNTAFTVVHALFRSPDTAHAYVAASPTLAVPSFEAARDKLVKEFKGGDRRLLLVMGENDLPTVLSLSSALKERVSVSAPAGLSCRLAVIPNAGHVPPNSLLEGLRAFFDGWKLNQPLTEESFDEIRAQVERRLAKFHVTGRLPEESLKELGETLLGEKKHGKAVEVIRYWVESYPLSPVAQVSLGDAYSRSGRPQEARECYRRALALAPGQAEAAKKLQELGK